MSRNRNGKMECPKCTKVCKLDRHHILPKRWYGPNRFTILICPGCHKAMEKIIEIYERQDSKTNPRHKLSDDAYVKIIVEFLTRPGFSYTLESLEVVEGKARCPKCKKQRRLVLHHMLPKRPDEINSCIMRLCGKCKKQLAILVDFYESGQGMRHGRRIYPEGYVSITVLFLTKFRFVE